MNLLDALPPELRARLMEGAERDYLKEREYVQGLIERAKNFSDFRDALNMGAEILRDKEGDAIWLALTAIAAIMLATEAQEKAEKES